MRLPAFSYLRTRCLEFTECDRGSVFLMVAAAGFLLITATGVAVDMTRAQILQEKIQSSLDAAGLAAGATASQVPSGNDSNGNPWTTASWVQYQATRYFNANFPSRYLGSSPVTPVATLSGGNQIITITASTPQATTFLQAVGINSVTVASSTQITRANMGMELALVLDNTGSMAYAVDPADSSTTKIVALQSAATELVNILYGTVNGATPPAPSNLWIGLVPFSQAVSIGTSYTSWMSSSDDASMDFGPTLTGSTCQKYTGVTPNVSGSYSSGSHGNPATCSYTLSNSSEPNFGLSNWTGCVMVRSNTTTDGTSGLTYDIADVPPSGSTGTLFDAYRFPPDGNYNTTWWTSSQSGHGSTYSTVYQFPLNTSAAGPNEYCPPQLTIMTATESTIMNGINAMSPGGDTQINQGLAWGWRLLSPRWTGYWGGTMNAASPELPLPYNTALMQKVVVLMTDGMDHFAQSGSVSNYTDYGYLCSGCMLGNTESTAETTLDNEVSSLCTAMKSNGIIIYTIGFGNPLPAGQTTPTEAQRDGLSGYVDNPLLQSCASKPSYYFPAPTNAQLQSAFQQIGDSLANLRVSQ